MIAPDAWLAERLARAPANLRHRILEALDGARGPLPQRLSAAAEALLIEARDAERPDPLTLLAADGLVTLACEYVADRDPERLRELR